MNRWIFFLVVLFGSAIIVHLYVRYNKKRYPHATDVDIAVWRVYVFSLCFAAVLYYAMVFLPLRLYPVHDYPDETQERRIERLMDKDKETTEIVNELRDTMSVALMVLGVYIFFVATFIGNIQKKRNIALLESNPETKNPLGL